jgi:hypothetical protein
MIVDDAHGLHEGIHRVGLTNAHPRFLRSFDNAIEAAETVAVYGGASSSAFGSNRQI